MTAATKPRLPDCPTLSIHADPACDELVLKCDLCDDRYCHQCDDGSTLDFCSSCAEEYRTHCHVMTGGHFGYYGGEPPEECGNTLPCPSHGGRGEED
jgi:hypothetical protein